MEIFDFKELTKLDRENREQYLWRLHTEVVNAGKASWNDITPFVNSQLIDDESKYYGESAYCKPCQCAELFYDNVFLPMLDGDAVSEIHRQQWELKKIKQQMFDERTEINRLLRMMARREALVESIRRIFQEATPIEGLSVLPTVEDGESDLLIHLTDIHGGIVINNAFNTFNRDVLAQRFESYLAKILQIQKRHKAKNCVVVIGETISGLIHPDLRVQSNENIVEQFRKTSAIISDFVALLAHNFEDVRVAITPGNHSRLSAGKNDAIRGENLDLLLPDLLGAYLRMFPNVSFIENDMDEYISTFYVRNEFVVSSHGDKDSISKVGQDMTMLLGKKPSIILLGHQHHSAMTTEANIKIIQTGSVSGTDSYAVDIRKNTDPEQTVVVVTEQGLDCLYNVNLNKGE